VSITSTPSVVAQPLTAADGCDGSEFGSVVSPSILTHADFNS